MTGTSDAVSAILQAVGTQLSNGSALAPFNNGSSQAGNTSSSLPGLPARNIHGFLFPAIIAGVPTTIIPIAFPVTTPGPSAPTSAVEEGEVLVVFVLAGIIWALPWFCSNSRLCCRCWKRCLSRRLGCYFMFGFLLNLTLISCVIAAVPDISANDVFFAAVGCLTVFMDQLETVLMQLGILLAMTILYAYRMRLVSLLGFDSQIIRFELRDFLTCFSMRRFSAIEVSILKAEDLPAGFGSRTLFLRLVLGCNEPLHSRPRDGCTTTINIKERLQLNYDPEDTSQKLTIMIKQQEVVSAAISQLAPLTGALVGGVGGLMMAGNPSAGAALGGVAGIGTANSLGPEVARLDMSHSMINRFRTHATKQQDDKGRSMMTTAPIVPWRGDHFMAADLVPQGKLWLRIVDVPAP